jgi:putative ATPase
MVPQHLMDSSRDAKGLGHGAGYQYPHQFPGHHVGQQYLPDALLGMTFYTPSNQGYEAEVARRLERWRRAQAQALGLEQPPQTVEDHDADTADSPR